MLCAVGVGGAFGFAQGLVITSLDLGSVAVTLLGGLLTASGLSYVITRQSGDLIRQSLISRRRSTTRSPACSRSAVSLSSGYICGGRRCFCHHANAGVTSLPLEVTAKQP